MFNTINTSLEEFLNKKIARSNVSLDNKTRISVITCTNRDYSLNNILDNFLRQDFIEKEIIIIINNNKIDLKKWENTTSKYKNIRIYKLDERLSLGRCLNFGVNKAKYEIIAKFDDDDYYGPKYLSDSIKNFHISNADIVGKHTIFVYFIDDNFLAIKDIDHENQYVHFVNGSTLMFKKNIFTKVGFRNISVNEDVMFCKDCIKNGFRVYSGNKYHYAYIRYPLSHGHTWKIRNHSLKKLFCTSIGEVHDFSKYIDI